MIINGKPNSTVGNGHELIFKASNIKIQWGNKFFYLFKNGKILVDSNFIYQADSVGDKDGIYILPDNAVIIKIGDQTVPISTSGDTYVSFVTPQTTTSEQKYQALVNIGFIYKELNDVTQDALKNGIIYIENTQKLYTVVDGVLTEFKAQFPNPFTEQLVITKNDDKVGALVIDGTGVKNSLAFKTLYIYSDAGESVFNSIGNYAFYISGQRLIKITPQQTQIFNTLVADTIRSSSGNFKVYTDVNGNSVLEVDQIINTQSSTDSLLALPMTWLGATNIAKSVEVEQGTRDLGDGTMSPTAILTITLANPNVYSAGDRIAFYVSNKSVIEVVHAKILTSSGSIITCNTDQNTQDYEYNIISLIYRTGKSKGDGTYESTIIFKSDQENNCQIVLGNYYGEDRYSDYRLEGVIGKFITQTQLDEEDNPISGYGALFEDFFCKKGKYYKGYNLPKYDDTMNFASTEWVNNRYTIVWTTIDSQIIPGVYTAVDLDDKAYGILFVIRREEDDYYQLYITRQQLAAGQLISTIDDQIKIYYRIYSNGWPEWKDLHELTLDKEVTATNITLKVNGTFGELSTLEIPLVTTTAAGLMSPIDKNNLTDAITNISTLQSSVTNLQNQINDMVYITSISKDGDTYTFTYNNGATFTLTVSEDYLPITGGTLTGDLIVQGTITTTEGPYESSDKRLKKNIEKINNFDIEKVKNVNLVQYQFLNKDINKYGVIAQDLEAVGLSNLIKEYKGYKSVDYISFLILKIHQLELEIQKLKQDII